MTIDLSDLQKQVYQNKLDKGFNTKDIALEFCRAHEELSEAFKKFNSKEDGVAEELADVAIFLLGMSEILGHDLEKEIVKKIKINKNRKYEKVDGVLTRVRTEIDP
jgi:NTP pyrophosphatase (non-canonical NTP hydrolase)